MKRVRRFLSILFCVSLFYLIFPCRAYAYLDLGTWTYIMQMIIAAMIGGLFAVKIFWNKIKNFFRKIFFKNN
jgi:hypothetical protein